jgi:ferrochelatase
MHLGTETKRMNQQAKTNHNALLIVGFGGPEGKEDVLPFLENVLAGKPVPRQRMLEVAEHYHHFGGVSPINQQVRDLIEALEPELLRRGVEIPIFWGNRNWHPLLADTLREMSASGVRRALALVLSAYGSYSGCRQYREDIERARSSAGADAPVVEKIRLFYNHPDFILANADRVGEGLARIHADRRSRTRVAFTAHSIPRSMANQCDYEAQLTETCRLIAEEQGLAAPRWSLVYQSRSGRPSDPWLEPDIGAHLQDLATRDVSDVVVHPVGFLSDHMEILHDLDIEASAEASRLGMNMVRTGTVGVHPRFVSMLAELVEERVRPGGRSARTVGTLGPSPDACAPECCLYEPSVPSRCSGKKIDMS